MAENVLVLMENGSTLPHRLPLPEGLSQRVAVGEARVLGPCDEDGTLLDPEPDPAPETVPGDGDGEDPGGQDDPGTDGDAGADSGAATEPPVAAPVKRAAKKTATKPEE